MQCDANSADAYSGEVSFGNNDSDETPYSFTVICGVDAPGVTVNKSVIISADLDNDGKADPADTLEYTVTVTNTGDGDALGVTLDDTPDAKTTLIGASPFPVNIGDMAPGETYTVTYKVKINQLPEGVTETEIVNVATVSGSNFDEVSVSTMTHVMALFVCRTAFDLAQTM